MKKLIYTVTLSCAMLGSSALVGATPDDKDRPGEKACETACEAKKEQCEKLKPDTAAFNACLAKVRQDCKDACKDQNENDRDRDRDHGDQ